MEDTPSTQSQAQPSNQKEELSQKQPEGESEDPRKCWHCNEPYGKEQDKCNRCHGFTMRTYERINGVLEKIEWRKLVVTSDDGDSYKRLEMREICRQIKEENSVAVFGRGKHDLGEERTKTVVLLYRPNGMKRLSYATGQRYATAKEWAEITEDEWKNFKIIVAGLKTESRYSLPPFFPKPKSLQVLTKSEIQGLLSRFQSMLDDVDMRELLGVQPPTASESG